MYRLDKDYTKIQIENSQPHLNSHEFKVKYQMSRENFGNLLELIKNHPVFGKASSKGGKQAIVNEQAMAFLAFIGQQGGNGTLSRSFYLTC